jgi:hypothetical protein
VGHDEPVPLEATRTDESAQEIRARLVHELRVLDDEHGRAVREQRVEEVDKQGRQRLAEEASVEPRRLGGRREVEAEQDPEQREPRLERRVGARHVA